jgi:hypothetical protein
VIEREFQQLAANWSDSVPEPTKYFLGFMATTLDANLPKQHIFVARYGMKKTQYTLVARRLKEIPSIL